MFVLRDLVDENG